MDRVIDADTVLTWGCRYGEMSVSSKSYDPLELSCGRDRVRGLTPSCVALGEMVEWHVFVRDAMEVEEKVECGITRGAY